MDEIKNKLDGYTFKTEIKCIDYLNSQLDTSDGEFEAMDWDGFLNYHVETKVIHKKRKDKYLILDFSSPLMLNTFWQITHEIFQNQNFDARQVLTKFLCLFIEDVYGFCNYAGLRLCVNLDYPRHDIKEKGLWDLVTFDKRVLGIGSMLLGESEIKFIRYSDDYELYQVWKASMIAKWNLYFQYMFNPAHPECAISVLKDGCNVGLIFRKSFCECILQDMEVDFNHDVFEPFSIDQKKEILNNYVNVWLPNKLGLRKSIYKCNEDNLVEESTVYYNVVDGTASKLRMFDQMEGVFIGFLATKYQYNVDAMEESFVFGNYLMIQHVGVF